MSNIVLQPNASGTGNITIATPNTNTDRTLNIPDVAGDLVTTGDTGTVSSGMMFSNFVNGAEVYDQFRLTADRSGDGTITANIERCDETLSATNSNKQISESSGIFSFPETGIYIVTFNFKTTMGASDNAVGQIMVTTDNSSFDEYGSSNTSAPTSYDQNAVVQTLIKITDISNQKVRFNMISMGVGTSLRGNTNTNNTSFTFFKISDI